MDKELLETQIAFFLKREFNAFEALALNIKKQLGETDSQYLPVPIDAPVQIPRLIINYPTFNIKIFKNRVDLFFQENYEQDKLEKVINVLLNILGLPIGRIGFVKRFFLQSDIEVIKKLLPKEKINGLNIKEVSLSVNVLRVIDDFECNSIEKIDPGFVTQNNGSKKSGLIVLKDCNTIVEQTLPDSLDTTALKNLISDLNAETNIFVLI